MSSSHYRSDRNRRTAKRILAFFLPLCLVTGVGIGYAYWTSSGSGTGQVTAGDVVAVPIAATATGLAPGLTVTANVVATNGNAGPVRLPGLVVPGTMPTPTSTVAACQALAAPGGSGTGVTVTAITAAAGPFDLAPGVATTIGTVTFAMANLTTSQDACKNAPFTVPLTTG